MRIREWICGFKGAVIGLATAGLLLSAAPTMAAAPIGLPASVSETQVARDVELSEGSVFHGQLVDSAGAPLAFANVSLERDGREIAIAKTDVHGAFAISGVSGGTYVVTAAGNSTLFRLWAPRTAPPMAQQAVLLVGGDLLARGQADGAVAAGALVVAGAAGAIGIGTYELVRGQTGS